MITPDQFRFFLDSGAFSAWSRGAVIDIDEYCEFIRANIHHIDVYANLDVLPGQPGVPAGPVEREAAAAASWDNYVYMRAQGLHPLPVYHIGEDRKWLDLMIANGCDYIGLGGLVGVPSAQRQAWLDEIFDYICDDAGHPKVKTHGFGMTAVPLIFRYPWFSVDSTTWIKITASGAIYVPAVINGEFVFDQVPTTVAVSETNPKQAQAGKHANSMGPMTRAILDRWLAECGKTFDEVAGNYYHRAVVNVTFFQRVSAEKKARVFHREGRARRGSVW